MMAHGHHQKRISALKLTHAATTESLFLPSRGTPSLYTTSWNTEPPAVRICRGGCPGNQQSEQAGVSFSFVSAAAT